MEMKEFYVLVNLTDEVMGINQSEIPDALDHSISRKCYLSDLHFKFPIGMFRYIRGGSKSDWVVIFQIPQGVSTSSTGFIKSIAAESIETLAHLLRRQTSDAISSIWSTVGSNSRLDTTLIYTLLLDGTYPIFCDTKIDNEFFQCVFN